MKGSLKRSKLQPPLPPNSLRLAVLALSPVRYVRSLGFPPFAWQEDVLTSESTRIAINGARQSGKSTIIATLPAHMARFKPGSLSIVLAATERQAVEDMEKVKEYMGRDPHYPEIMRDSDSQIELANGSRIVVVPATEKSARGYSKPDLVIMDEASRIEDPVYTSGVRAMFTDNPDGKLILISTPNGRTGFFYKTLSNPRFERYEIRAPWDVDDMTWTLAPTRRPEEAFRKAKAKEGIRGYYSPRHWNQDEQQENLEAMGPTMYRQECLVEIVEPAGQVFAYEEITAALNAGIEGLYAGTVALPEAKGL